MLGQLKAHLRGARPDLSSLGDWNLRSLTIAALWLSCLKRVLSSDSASRLRLQVETWLNQLFSPLKRWGGGGEVGSRFQFEPLKPSDLFKGWFNCSALSSKMMDVDRDQLGYFALA